MKKSFLLFLAANGLLLASSLHAATYYCDECDDLGDRHIANVVYRDSDYRGGDRFYQKGYNSYLSALDYKDEQDEDRVYSVDWLSTDFTDAQYLDDKKDIQRFNELVKKYNKKVRVGFDYSDEHLILLGDVENEQDMLDLVNLMEKIQQLRYDIKGEKRIEVISRLQYPIP